MPSTDPVEAPFDPCPMGCGRTTNDPGGGPCENCWALLDKDDADAD